MQTKTAKKNVPHIQIGNILFLLLYINRSIAALSWKSYHWNGLRDHQYYKDSHQTKA
jgi:hypothetical protein